MEPLYNRRIQLATHHTVYWECLWRHWAVFYGCFGAGVGYVCIRENIEGMNIGMYFCGQQSSSEDQMNVLMDT